MGGPVRPRLDQVRGLLLGTLVGDALGMPVEGWSAAEIRSRYGILRDMQSARRGRGTYTDDSQMAIALAEALLDTPGRLDQDRVSVRFARSFEADRGYSAGTTRLLKALREGISWKTAVANVGLPGGSYGNGAAMRVAPVSVAFYWDGEMVARAAEQQANVTGHHHTLGKFGAKAQALSVRHALHCGAQGVGVDAEGLLIPLLDEAPEPYRAAFSWILENLGEVPEVAALRLGTGVDAASSVPAALWAWLSCSDSAEEAVVRAVSLGGDTDTLGAMAGALAGAYHGADAFPRRWVEALEAGPKGADYVLELADRLHALLSQGT